MNTHYLRTRLFTKTIKQLAFLLLLLCIGFSTKAQTHYWFGGSGNWSDQNHWSLTSGGTATVTPPNSTDDVVFDANSGFTPANKTITMPAGTNRSRSIVFTCTVAPTMTGPGRLDTYGNVTLQAGMTMSSWSGEWHFYQNNVSAIIPSPHTITTANNTFVNSLIVFETENCDYVVNNLYTQAAGTMSVNLNNKTNSVTFNQVAKHNILTINKGTVNDMAGFNTGTFNINNGNSVFKSYGNGNGNGIANDGEMYLNAGNTLAGNTYTFNTVGEISYSQPLIFDITNCTFHITNFFGVGRAVTTATINALGSTIHFLPSADFFYPYNYTWHNVIIDEATTPATAPSFRFFINYGITANYTLHVSKPIFDNVSVNRNCFFQVNNNSVLPGSFPLINNTLTFTAGHRYSCQTYQNFDLSSSYITAATGIGQNFALNLASTATLNMLGTCLSPITLNGVAFEFAAGSTLNVDYLVTNHIKATGPSTPYNAGANSYFIPNTATTGWNIGPRTHRNLVWVGAVPSNTNTIAQYGNWGDVNNWRDITGLPLTTYTTIPTDGSGVPVVPGYTGTLTPICPLPTVRDSVIFPANSYVNCDQVYAYCEGMNWQGTGRFYGITNKETEVWGSLYLSPQMKNDFAGTFWFKSDWLSVRWITTNNQAFDGGVAFNSSNGNGSWLLKDSLLLPVGDPDCDAGGGAHSSFLMKAGTLNTGTSNCTPGDGQCIKAKAMWMLSGTMNLFNSNVIVWNLSNDMVYTDFRVDNPPPTLNINAGTSSIILKNIQSPNVASGFPTAWLGQNQKYYNVICDMPAIGTYTNTSTTTHGVGWNTGTIIRRLTSKPLSQVILANYGGGGTFFKAVDLQGTRKTVTLANIFGAIDKASLFTVDTLLTNNSIDFGTSINVRSYLKFAAGQTYNLGTTATGSSAMILNMAGATTNTITFEPCVSNAYSYPKSTATFTAPCTNPITINWGSFTANTTPSITATNVSINDNTVTGPNAPFYYNGSSNTSGTTTGWSGIASTPRALRWKDGTTIASHSGNWLDDTQWELVAKSGVNTYSVVAPSPQCPPTKIDTVVFDNTSFGANNQQVYVNLGSSVAEVASMYWNNITVGSAPQFSSTPMQSLSIYDNLKFDANMVQNYAGPILFRGIPASTFTLSTITSATKQFNNKITFDADGVNKVWNIADNITAPYNSAFTTSVVTNYYVAAVNLFEGKLTGDNITWNIGSFYAADLLNRSLSIKNATVNLSSYFNEYPNVSGSWDVVNSNASFSLSAGGSVINNLVNPNMNCFCGGGKKYNNVNFISNGEVGFGRGYADRDTFNVVTFNPATTSSLSAMAYIGRTGSYLPGEPLQCYFHKVIANVPLVINSNDCKFDSLVMNKTATINANEKYNKYLKFSDNTTYYLKTNTVQWAQNKCEVDLIGSSGANIQLYSTTTNQQAYIRKDSAYLCADFINMRDIWAIGGGSNTASCNSYTNTGVNTNCAPLATFSTHCVSSCDTITDLGSSCGPWDVNNLTRGRADFNSGSNADLQANDYGWAKRGYPPVPDLNLALASPSICLGDSIRLVFTGTGYVPFTIHYYTITGDTISHDVKNALDLNGYNASTGSFTYTPYEHPTTNTSYYLGYLVVDRCFNARSAQGTGTVNVTIKPSPSVISAVSSPTTICNAVPFILNASATGANTYTLFPTPTGTASPTAMTSYTVGAAVNGSVTIAAGTYTTTSTPSTYTVYAAATTSLGCTSLTRTPVQITINPTPSVAITTNSIACFGNATGAVSYTATGGAGSGYSISPSITSLTAGVYNYTVTDANGCKTNTTATIAQPASALSAVASNTDNTSCATPNGSAIASASGGTSGYTYLWQGGQTTPGITNQTGGTYTVTVTDNNLCTYTTQVTIANPTAPVVTASSNTNSICSGNNITITPGGGATIYTITPSVGTATVVSGATIFTPTVNTSYAVAGTNSTSCLSNTVNVSVTVNTTPTVAITAASPTICAGQNTTLNLSGASTYTLLNTGSPVSSGAIVSPTTSTTYSVQGSTPSCTGAFTGQLITVNPLPVVTAVASNTPICSGNTASLTAGGATTYTWISTGSTNTVITVSPANSTNYIVSGTDGNNCSNTQTVGLVVNPTPTVNISTATPTICAGETATLTAATANTYAWSTTSSANTTTVMPTGTTVYTVTGTNTVGSCTTTAQYTVTVNAKPDLALTNTTGIACLGDANGTATVNTTSGTAGYNYTWTGSASTASVATGLAAGNHTAVVTDNKGCKDTLVLIIAAPSASLSTAIATATTGCNLSNGTATLTPAGGWNTGYTYVWQSSPSTTNTATGYVAGSYTAQVTDANGCKKVQNFTITNPAPPTITALASSPSICSGGITTITPNGAVSYSITGTAVSSPTTGTSFTVNPTSSTSYSISGTDANNCVSSQISVPVTVNPTPTVAIAATSGTICSGQTTTLTAATANNYSWSTGGTGNSISIAPNTNTVITVTGTNTAGSCTATAQYSITVNPTPTVAITASSGTLCSGQTTTLTAATANNYSWSTGGTGNTISIAPNTNTVITVTGTNTAGSCTATAQYSITVNPTPTVAIAATSGTLCSGQTTTLTAATANNYSWSTGGTGNSISIAPNTNTVITVTGTNTAGSCTATAQYSITVNPTPTLAIAATSGTLCSGQTTTLTAATANNYSWSTGGTGNSISIAPNTNTVITVTCTNTAGSCTATAQYSITVNPTPTVAIAASSSTLCSGQTVTLTAATANNYSWSTGASVNTTTLAPLTNTIVTVTGTNTVGSCTTSAQFTLNVSPLPVIASSTITNVSCYGLNNGSALFTPASGTPGYTITGTGASGTSATNLSPANYTYTITDALGCKSTSTLSITQPTAALLTTAAQTATNTSCTSPDGVATPTINGGTPNYTITPSSGTVSGNNITGLPTGTHTYTITDANGCIVSNSVQISGATGITSALAAQTNVQCYGNTTASISVQGSGEASGAYTYSLTPVTATTSALSNSNGTFTGLGQGTYSVLVTGAVSNCISSQNISISQPTAALALTANTNSVLCNGGSATASATITGGTPSYTLNWNGANSAATTHSFTAGTYTVSAIDNNGCSTATQTLTITQPTAALVLAANSNSVLCNGGSATASATITGGTPSYTLNWNGANSAATTHSFTAGTYTVSAIDINGCVTATQTLTITQPTAALALAANSNSVLCNGGIATTSATVTGGTPSYTLNWNGTNSSATTYTFTAGTYTVNAIDNNGCSSTTQTLTITQPTAALVLAANSNSILCNGGSAIATATVTGGTPSYTLNWNGASSTATTHTFTAGTYTVNVIDNNGCSSATQTLAISQPAQLSALITNTTSNSSCVTPNGSFTVNATGGTPGYTYNISNSTGIFTGQATGTHSITVSDANACTYTLSAMISGVATPVISTATQTNVLCNGQNTGAAVITASSGTQPYTYNWTNISANSNAITNVSQGIYIVTATDAGNCKVSYTFTITEPGAINAITTSMVNPCVGQNNGSVSIEVNGGTPNYSYSWANSSSTSNSITDVSEGQYTATITDANGCVFQYPVSLKAEDGISCTIRIPEIFSPNGDGKNDKWEIKGLENYPNNNVQVFNRWGDEVFKSNPYNNDWQGSNRGDKSLLGQGALPASTYYFILDLGNGDKPITGYVQLTK